MPSKIGVVYGTSSGAIRYIVAPNTDDELTAVHAKRLQPGESIELISIADILVGDNGLSMTKIRQALEAKIGKASPELKCAVVGSKNDVTDVIMADPAIDNIPTKRLIVSDVASKGDTAAGDVIIQKLQPQEAKEPPPPAPKVP